MRAFRVILYVIFAVLIYILIDVINLPEFFVHLIPNYIQSSFTPERQEKIQEVMTAVKALCSAAGSYGLEHLFESIPIISDIFDRKGKKTPEISFEIPVVTIRRKYRPNGDLEVIALLDGDSATFARVRVTNEGETPIMACEINEHHLHMSKLCPKDSYDFFFKLNIKPRKPIFIENINVPSDYIMRFISPLQARLRNWRDTRKLKLKISVQNGSNEYFNAPYRLRINCVSQVADMNRMRKFRKGHH